LPPGIVKKAAE
jgi:hypothetical protein